MSYGLEKFVQYTYKRKVIVQNDHKPLEIILKKPLSQVPKRLQDIIMRLFRYDIEFHFIKGTNLVIADALSRAFIEEQECPRILNVNILEEFPDARITEVSEATENDPNLHFSNITIEKHPGTK